MKFNFWPLLLSVFIVFFYMLQPRSIWCVTPCVQTQGAGVQAQTSVSPANTTSVDERAWTGAIYTRGESHLPESTRSRLVLSNLKAGPSCTYKYVIVVVCFPEDVGLKWNGLDSINNWGAIKDNWKSYFFIIVKSKSKTALKLAYLTNEYHTGSVLRRKNFQETSSDVFLYIFIWHQQTFIHEGNRSNWFCYQVLDGSPAGILQKGFRSERQWNNVIKTRTKHQLTGDEWQQMNRANVTKLHQNPDAGVLRLNSFNGSMSVNCGLPLKSPGGCKEQFKML